MVQETVPVELRIRQRVEPSLVPPAEQTPNGLYYLSNLDQNIAVIVQTVYLFRAAADNDSSSSFDVLRESLAKVLVAYYPLAGRLTMSGEGKLIVDCTGEGAATRARPSLASTLLVTAWSRLPFDAADFGWGPPAACGPAALPEREVALFLSCGGGGVRVLLGLPPAAMAEFQRIVDEVVDAA
ncbi:hypothetical protein PR202_gb03913 [Eleusine coracana subsp. coracana]|uniref:Uncharacterized protein n=1 Tax=Eleusine coracana subsp. coracana TaxID=191504 RepID=A0AAV5E0R1_ELECO|nr:hypothetical protein PR202_gb03913 [Eleusine coracana subsp. coracana]